MSLFAIISTIVFLAPLVAMIGGLLAFNHWRARRIDARYPPVGDLVETGAGALHVVERAPSGPARGAILLLHGASGNHADVMLALGDELAARGFRVVAVDRPGHGWSARMAGGAMASPARQAAIIREVLQRRGVDQAIVVGHSLSGALALAMALDAPDFTRGLVLLSPVSHPWPGAIDWPYRVAAIPFLGWFFRRLVVQPVGLAAMRGGVRSVFTPAQIPQNYVEATMLPLMFRPDRFLANSQDVIALKPAVTAMSQRYGDIVAPTAIVSGDRDGIVSTEIHSIEAARAIPGATLTILPGVGHSPHFSAPDAVIAAILDVDRRASGLERVGAPLSAELDAGCL